jgi:hypothetical protein
MADETGPITDEMRINWLAADEDRLEDLRWDYINADDGCTFRECIDRLMGMQA